MILILPYTLSHIYIRKMAVFERQLYPSECCYSCWNQSMLLLLLLLLLLLDMLIPDLNTHGGRGLWCLHIRHTPFPNVYLWHITFFCNLFVTTCMYTYHPCMLYQSTWMIDNKLNLYMDSCIIHIIEKNQKRRPCDFANKSVEVLGVSNFVFL